MKNLKLKWKLALIITIAILALVAQFLFMSYSSNVILNEQVISKYDSNIDDVILPDIHKIVTGKVLPEFDKIINTNVKELIKDSVIEDSKRELKAVVDSQAILLGELLKGKSEEEQTKILQEMTGIIRFYKDKSGYFFAYKTNGIAITVPVKTSLNGTNQIGMKDINGQPIVKLLAECAKRGGDYLIYHFYKDTPKGKVITPKLGYATLIPGTDIFLGTGRYLDDVQVQQDKVSAMLHTHREQLLKHVVDAEKVLKTGIVASTDKIAAAADKQIREIWYIQVIFVAIVIVLLCALNIYISSVIAKPMRCITEHLKRYSQGEIQVIDEWKDYITNDLYKRKDESGEMIYSLKGLREYLTQKIDILSNVANGNLTDTVNPSSDSDTFSQNMQKMLSNLNGILSNVKESINQVNTGSTQINDASQSLSQGATEQAASIEEITTSMTEFGNQTKRNADNATEAENIVQQASQSASTGKERMQELTEAMTGISDNGNKIMNVIKVIDDIAFQTNLLALNAAVEAARAGRHGKGFAVVAEEVRNLASRSAKAARETSELIEGSNKQITSGAALVESTAQALNDIADFSVKTNDIVREISAASNEQANGVTQINIGLEQISKVTEQNTASAEETASSATEMMSQTRRLASLINEFSLNGSQPQSVTSTYAAPLPQATQAPKLAAPQRAALPPASPRAPQTAQPSPKAPLPQSRPQSQQTAPKQETKQNEQSTQTPPADNAGNNWGMSHDTKVVKPSDVIKLDDDEFGKY